MEGGKEILEDIYDKSRGDNRHLVRHLIENFLEKIEES